MLMVYLNGLFLGLSLIMALGPQNVFLIKQGARKNHSMLSMIICFICDMILAYASVSGLHRLLLQYPTLENLLIWLGTAFLLYYASKAFRSAFKKKEALAHASQQLNRFQIVLLALGFSLLNPHAIIDTMVIIGSGSTQFPEQEFTFLWGVITASFVWFSSLTITSHYFSNILTKDVVWKMLELVSGSLMIFIGVKLVLNTM